MKKIRRNIVGTLLGLMASISSTSAMKDGSVNESTNNTKNTSTQTVSKSKKRNQDTTSVYWNIAKLTTSLLTANEIGSNLPVIKYFTHPLLRQLSGYRVRSGVRGEFIRSNGPGAVNYGYTIFNESDRNYYQLIFRRHNSLYTRNKVTNKCNLVDLLKKIDVDNINKIKLERNLLIFKFYNFNVINLAMEDGEGNVLSGDDATGIRKFLESDDYTASDAADALNKVLEFVNVINSNKSDKDKVDLINQQFNVTCVARAKKGDIPVFRIFVKERKNAKGKIRKIFAEFRMQDEKTKEEIEKEDAEKLNKEMENKN